MAKSQLFEMNLEQKKLLQDISSICGVKQEIVSQVWKYTLLLNYLNIIEKKKNPNISIIQVPFIGKIWTNLKSDGEVESSVYLSTQIIETIKKIKAGDKLDIIKYFTQEFIDPVIEEIQNQ